jgi:hypothetical protein
MANRLRSIALNERACKASPVMSPHDEQADSCFFYTYETCAILHPVQEQSGCQACHHGGIS